ncbi:MAG: glycosyltransferase family 9 protein [Chitinophagaceae bacterium]
MVNLFSNLKKIPTEVIISRTDSVGDIVLVMPVAAVLKKYFPQIKISLLGNLYTKDVAATCKYFDNFIDVNNFMTKKTGDNSSQAILHVKPVKAIAKRAKQLKIAVRVGTINRPYHWTTCNKLIKLDRKNSPLHEAQLNLKILKPFGINKIFSLQEIALLYGMEKLQPLPAKDLQLIEKNKYNLIVHPKSKGNGREWDIENYIQLINSLDKNKFQIFISGVESEKKYAQIIANACGDNVINIAGAMPLNEFISFIWHCDGVVACSTGPLHIAAALNKDALGIYAPLWSIRPERWGPVGVKAQVFVSKKTCDYCIYNRKPCHCINEILPYEIKLTLEKCATIKTSQTSNINIKS